MSVSVTNSLCLLETVYICHRQAMSVTDNLCLSQTVCVSHRQAVSVTDRVCLSHTGCVCHRQSGSVTDTLCLSQTVFLIDFGQHHDLIMHDFRPYFSVTFGFRLVIKLEGPLAPTLVCLPTLHDKRTNKGGHGTDPWPTES